MPSIVLNIFTYIITFNTYNVFVVIIIISLSKRKLRLEDIKQRCIEAGSLLLSSGSRARAFIDMSSQEAVAVVCKEEAFLFAIGSRK